MGSWCADLDSINLDCTGSSFRDSDGKGSGLGDPCFGKNYLTAQAQSHRIINNDIPETGILRVGEQDE